MLLVYCYCTQRFGGNSWCGIKSTKFRLKKRLAARRNVHTEPGAALASKPPVSASAYLSFRQ